MIIHMMIITIRYWIPEPTLRWAARWLGRPSGRKGRSKSGATRPCQALLGPAGLAWPIYEQTWSEKISKLKFSDLLKPCLKVF